MKALVWHGDRELAIEELAAPPIPDGHVRFDVVVAGICGSDLHGYRGHPGPRVPPLILGHEAIGRVDGRDGRFVPFPLAVCGGCAACARGQEQFCERRGLLGMDRAGVFAEHVAVPESALVPVPGDMSDAVAALTEPYAVGLSAVREDAIGPGAEVLVLGAGAIGALATHAARSVGARVTAVDTISLRREVADRLGAETVLEDIAQVPASAFDVVFDCVGIEATVLAGIRAARRGGRVAVIGLGADSGELPIASLAREGVTVRGHFAYTRSDFEEAARRLDASPPDTTWMSFMDLGEGAAGFAGLVDHPETYAKVMLAVGG